MVWKKNVFLKFMYYFLNIKFSLTIKKFNSIQRGVIIIISHFIILSVPSFLLLAIYFIIIPNFDLSHRMGILYQELMRGMLVHLESMGLSLELEKHQLVFFWPWLKLWHCSSRRCLFVHLCSFFWLIRKCHNQRFF